MSDERNIAQRHRFENALDQKSAVSDSVIDWTIVIGAFITAILLLRAVLA